MILEGQRSKYIIGGPTVEKPYGNYGYEGPTLEKPYKTFDFVGPKLENIVNNKVQGSKNYMQTSIL